MNGIAKRIRQLREIEKKSLRVFARELDISPSALGNYERGRIPSMEFIYNLFLRKNVSVDWLLTGVGQPNNYPKVDLKIITSGEIKQHFNHIESRENYVILRLLTDSAAAESPSSINENDIEGYAVTYRSWCKNPEMTTCVRVHGSSMSPLLPDGSIVAINHQERNPEKLKGKIVAALVDDGVTIKYFDYTETHFIFYSENKQFTPIFLEKGRENVIIGKIDWFWGRL